jgi:hypothetical protein
MLLNKSAGSGRPLLGRQQNIDQLMECRVRPLVDFVHFHCADGMLHDQHRMIRSAEGFLLGFCERLEGVCNHRDCEFAALLKLD